MSDMKSKWLEGCTPEPDPTAAPVISTTNPPHGGCDCPCHHVGKAVMHFIACCTPDKGIELEPGGWGGRSPRRHE